MNPTIMVVVVYPPDITRSTINDSPDICVYIPLSGLITEFQSFCCAVHGPLAVIGRSLLIFPVQTPETTGQCGVR